MENKYQLVVFTYPSAFTYPGICTMDVIGEFSDRDSLNMAIKKVRCNEFNQYIGVGFLVNGEWYYGTKNSKDPIAWDK